MADGETNNTTNNYSPNNGYGERIARVEKAFESIEAAIAIGFQNMKDAIDDLKGEIRTMREGLVTKESHNDLERRVKTLEDSKVDPRIVDGLQNNQTWLARLIIGAVVLALIGAIIVIKQIA